MEQLPEMLTVEEAAAFWRVHPATIRRMIRRGDLPAARAGRVWRIPSASLMPDLVPQPEKPEPEPHTAAYYIALARGGRRSSDAAPDRRRSRG